MSLVTHAFGLDARAGKHDRVVFSGGTEVRKDETVDDVVAVQGPVVVDGFVRGDVVAVKGDVLVRGTIRGDVVAGNGQIGLARSGRINGVAWFDRDTRKVAGGRSPNSFGMEGWTEIGERSWASLGAPALWLPVTLCLLLLGVALTRFLPGVGPAAHWAFTSHFWLTMMWGIGGVVALWFLMELMPAWMIAGVPFWLWLAPAIAVPPFLAASFVLGRIVTRKGAHPILAFAVGFAVLRALDILIAGGVWRVAVFFGVGALVVATMPVERETAEPAGQPA